MSEEEARENKQIELSNLADKYLDEALRNGDPFTEGLCNWAMNKAMQEIGGL